MLGHKLECYILNKYWQCKIGGNSFKTKNVVTNSEVGNLLISRASANSMPKSFSIISEHGQIKCEAIGCGLNKFHVVACDVPKTCSACQ